MFNRGLATKRGRGAKRKTRTGTGTGTGTGSGTSGNYSQFYPQYFGTLRNLAEEGIPFTLPFQMCLSLKF